MKATASQTVGPFFRIGLEWLNGTGAGSATVRGKVIDGLGKPVPDAVLEIWQPGGGFCRVPTDPDGGFRFATGHGTLTVLIFMRGLLKHLMTRVYLQDDPSDEVLRLVPQERRQTLIAQPEGGELVWNVVLQGEHETVFFEV